jgi:hypothetical protein
MIEIEMNTNNLKVKTYPYIGIEKNSGHVVLFTRSNTGMCLVSGTTLSYVGEYSENWMEYIFKPYNDIITIKNK